MALIIKAEVSLEASAFLFRGWVWLAVTFELTNICESAFANCTSLKSISIPDSVTTISSEAFANCTSLNNIELSSNWNYVSGWNRSPFIGCTNLKEIVIPNGATRIPVCAFYLMESLESITIPDSVTEISDYAFSGCDSLTDVYFNGTRAQWNSIDIASDGNEYLVLVTLHCTDSEQENPSVTYQKGDGAVKLTWNKVSGAEKYGIVGYVNGKWELLATVPSTTSSYVLKNLKAGTKYKVAVIAMFNGKWNTNVSKAIVVTPNEAAYPIVTSKIQGSAFQLNWTAVPNAKGYAIAYITNGKTWKTTKTVDAKTTSFTYKNTPKGTYYFAVCAYVNGKFNTTDIANRAVKIVIK